MKRVLHNVVIGIAIGSWKVKTESRLRLRFIPIAMWIVVVASYLVRDSKIENGTLFRGGLDPDFSAMPFDNFLADRQSDAGPGIFAPGVQPLEYHKNALGILRADSDAVIPDGKNPFSRTMARSYVDFGRSFAAELDCIADQVLKELLHLCRIDREPWERVTGNFCTRFPDADIQIFHGGRERGGQVRCFNDPFTGADAGKCQQVGDEPLHAGRTIDRSAIYCSAFSSSLSA